ncbi:CU044_5270 family protein [Streptomyces sp. TX20-6-3]|uniref:CU044_5270 family protein n=1 Tax=Streptomyces sp. TX20-6-3 TaxID=3028705 RepID=UPI0029A5C436|nr:CU044_5270 family protein [Streptomyces sp. TX20-6-3]MDX2564959.1 CU044_5270 family protein [Streptomyces sp. TX20-6-3]
MNAFAPRTQHHRKADAHADALLRAELAELLPPPPVPEPAPERERELRHAVLRTALASGDGAVARPPRVRRSRGGLRLGWIAAPVAACAVVAGAVVLAPQEGPAGSPGRVSAGQPAAPEAVRFLSGAALVAAAAPAPDARPGGYVYVRSLVAHAGRDAAGGPAALPPAHRREVWLSVDGSRPGLLREPGAADTELGADEPPVYELDGPGATPRRTTLATAAPSVTNPTHTYVATLPTDPDALLRLIQDQTREGDGDADQRAFTAIGTLLAETWAPPQVTAALYGAAARIPGVTLLPSAKDAAGREGVAVARTAHGEQTQWIFDRTTSAFLGERTVLTETTSAGGAGTVLGVSAVLAKASAPAPGVLPKG